MRIEQTMTRLGFTVVLALVAMSACDCRAEAAGDTADALLAKLKYGFRYDPMKWVETSKSLQAAQIRVHYLKAPRADDLDILNKEIDKILAEQQEDGSWLPKGKHDRPLGTTVGEVRRLLDLGCPPERPELKKAVDFACRTSLKEKGALRHGTLAMACLTGWRKGNEPVRSLLQHAERCKTEPDRGGCPWTIGGAFALWAGRRLADVKDVLAAELVWIPKRMNVAGFNSYKDPWGYVGLAGQLDHPLARRIVVKQLPLLLRGQGVDGSWGGWEQRSYKAFRALIRHRLLEPVRRLPPLPADWKIVRSIPAPNARLAGMTWDGERLWVLNLDAREAIAVSPKDGQILKRLKLPSKGPNGIGWWRQLLAVSQWEPRGVALVDPETGEQRQLIPMKGWLEEPGGVTKLNGKLWVADGWNWVVIRVDPKKPEKLEHVLMSCPTGGGWSDVAAAGDGIWHFDRFWPALVKTPARAKVIGWTPEAARSYETPEPLDWGEKPFPGLAGVAWDGKQLWALDGRRKRICVIEKANFSYPDSVDSAQIVKALPAIIADLRFPGPAETSDGGTSLVFENTVRNPLPVGVEIRYTWDSCGSAWRVGTERGSIKLAPKREAAVKTTASFDRQRPAPAPTRRATIIIDGVEVTQVEHSPSPPILRRFGSAARVAKTPTIDGKLSEGEYGAAELNGQFRLYKGHGAAKHDTNFRLAYDEQALYLGIVVREPSPDGVTGEPRKRDGDVWRDDDLELFVDATFDRKTYHQFALGLKHNAQFDCIGGPKHGSFGDVKWDGKWRSTTKVGEGAVIVEIALPYTTLGVKAPKPGDKWGLNLCRNRLGKGKKDGKTEMSAWCITYRSFHVPTHFGTVTFE